MKGTRKILVSSFIMIIACCLLFAGTTFAWFSDSVSSNNNIITAGTLDIELEYYDSVANDWVEVEEDTALLSASDLWEPGYTKVVYFKVTNAGTLGLRYNFNMNITEETGAINVYNKVFKLSDYLDYATEMGLPSHNFLTKDTLPTEFSDLAQRNVLTQTNELAAGSVEYGYLVITMPTTVGNEANTKPGTQVPSINVGFDLLASQLNGEAHGGEADVPVASVTKLPELPTFAAGQIQVVNGNNTLEDINVETAYEFTALDTNVTEETSYYSNWIADFVVTFNADIPAGALGLVGQYDMAQPDEYYDGSWLAYLNPEDISSDEQVRLLESFGSSKNYAELCSVVKNFNCGAFDVNNALADVTMTVELRLYETYSPEEAYELTGKWTTNLETGVYKVLAKYEHTFTDEVTPKTFTVKNSGELNAVLEAIKAPEYHNTDILINLQEANYVLEHNVYQYPLWNGKLGSESNYAGGVSGAPVSNIHFVGNGNVVFKGAVNVYGFGNSGTGAAQNTAVTTFTNITFQGKTENDICVSVLAAANNVKFEGCTFKNAQRVLLGNGGADSIASVAFNDCTFNNSGNLSGYFLDLVVTNCEFLGSIRGFINAQKAGHVTVKDSTVVTDTYFVRTSNVDGKIVVENTNITINKGYESGLASSYEGGMVDLLVWFRGSNESATFTNCTLTSNYVSHGVDANSTLTIN